MSRPRIEFVHTPMSAIAIPENEGFWQGFDAQYQNAHPGMPQMTAPIMWELPHWITWMGGVLDQAGYEDLGVVDLYTSANTLTGPSTLDEATVSGLLQRRGPADIYLFSPMTANNHLALATAEQVKALYPQAKTIFGGVMSTPTAHDTARHPAVDFVVRGRGERALPALLDTLRTNGDLNKVRQLTYRDSESRIIETSGMYADMLPAALPHDKIDLFSPEAGKHIRYIRQVYGLGCPYRCSFCTIQTIGQRQNYFPPDRVLDSMDAYRARFGEDHHFYMGDETFTMEKGPTLEVLEAFKSRGDIRFDAQTRLNRLKDPEVITALGAAGCAWLEIGLETGIEQDSKRFKQHTKFTELTDSLLRLQDAGIAPCAFMVNGLPGQTIDTMRQSIEFAAGLIEDGYLAASYFNQLVPYPGSDLFANPDKYGISILHQDFSRYHEDLPPVYLTDQARDPDKVHEVYKEGLRVLGQVMTQGAGVDVSRLASLGTFWNGQHV